MTTTEKTQITVETTVKAPIEKVWKLWITPEHITRWNNASDDWHTPKAENDLREGGKFVYRMEAKDGSFGFDFEAVYDVVNKHKEISYTMTDGRKATTIFSTNENLTEVTTTFDAETENSTELQEAGWQSILNNFKKYVESE